MDTKEFIKRAIKTHGNKYNYDNTNYVNSDTKLCIICTEHGEFWQRPHKHLYGQGCPKCRKKHNYTTEEWVEIAKDKLGNEFDYSKVNYVNNHTKVCIVCPKHGDFLMRPNDILNGQTCPICALEKRKESQTHTTEEFVQAANEKHNNKYDYSKVNYINSSTKVCIICPKHGDFYQRPNTHLNGCGCQKCGIESRSKMRRLPLTDFVYRANQIHKFKYEYNQVEYKNVDDKVCIVCPRHGEFWQTPHAHLQGQGCPHCSKSLMEEKVNDLLTKNCIVFEEQKTFTWLKNKISLRLDFYLSEYNIAIECQGRQHFEVVNAFKGEKGLEYIRQNDDIKYQQCKLNGVKIYYINYSDNIEQKFNEIIKEIKNV